MLVHWYEYSLEDGSLRPETHPESVLIVNALYALQLPGDFRRADDHSFL